LKIAYIFLVVEQGMGGNLENKEEPGVLPPCFLGNIRGCHFSIRGKDQQLKSRYSLTFALTLTTMKFQKKGWRAFVAWHGKGVKGLDEDISKTLMSQLESGEQKQINFFF